MEINAEAKPKYITLRGTNSWFLSVVPKGLPNEGQIFANGQEYMPELFELIELSPDQPVRKVALKSLSTGQYVSALDGGGREIVANRAAIQAWETFILIAKSPDKISLQAHNGQFLSDDQNGRIVAAFPASREFTMAERQKSMFTTLRAPNSALLSVVPKGLPNEGQIFANGKDEMPELFDLIELGSDHRGRKVALQTVSTGKYVAAEGGGGSPLVANRSAIGEWESFILTPGTDGKIRLLAHNGLYVGEESSNPRMVAAFPAPGNQQFSLEVRRGRVEDYPEHYFDQKVAQTMKHEGVTGCYFQGHAYLFHQVKTWQTAGILYSRYRVKADESIEVVDSNRPVVRPVGVAEWQYSLAPCVHNGVLYVFWNTTAGQIRYSSTIDGATWTAPVYLPNFTVECDRQIAAVSAGERMYVFASRAGQSGSEKTYVLVMAYTDDDSKTWATEVSPDWKNVRNIAACAFTGSDGKLNIMLGMTTEFGNVWTGRYEYQPGGSGSRLSLLKSEEHTDLRGQTDFIALAAGSIRHGSLGMVVQMFINGWHSDSWSQGWTPTKKREYIVATGRWSHLAMMTGAYTRFPTWKHTAAFQYQRPIVDPKKNEIVGVQQEIWYVTTYQNVAESPAYLYFARFQSDKLKLMSTKHQSVPELFQPLIGVVEGPPPYVLNGRGLDGNESVSQFQFGWSESQTAQMTATFKLGAYVNLGGKVFGSLQVGLGLSTEVAFKEQTSKTVTVSIEKNIGPLADKNQVTYVYLSPTIIRKAFAIYDWEGESSGRSLGTLYVFNVSQSGIDFRAAPVLGDFPSKPDTHQFNSWLHRSAKLSDYVGYDPWNLPVTWKEGGSTQFKFDTQIAQLKSRETTVAAKISVGAENIFDMGGNSSFSYEVQHGSTKTESIGFSLNYPPARKDHPEDIVRVKLRICVFTPEGDSISTCYWIPKDKQTERPWCVAWSVDEVQTNAQRAKELSENEPAPDSISGEPAR